MKRELEDQTERQKTDADDVSRLVARLKQTEAPRDFERAVMARIADGARPPRRVFGLSPALAYALPVILIAVVALAVYVSARRTVSPQTDVAGADTSQFLVDQPPPPAAERPSPDQTAVTASSPAERKAAPPVDAPALPNSIKRKQATAPAGGSIDEAVNEKRAVAPTASDQARDEVIGNVSIPVREMLTQLGMESDFAGGWVVRHVTANSQAERSGIKPGDVVLALGHTVLNADTEFRGSFEASTIRIRRSGQELDLGLK